MTVSPAHVASLEYAVPMEQLEATREFYRRIGVPVRIRYRGPRKNGGSRSYCLKSRATHFAVYPNSPFHFEGEMSRENWNKAWAAYNAKQEMIRWTVSRARKAAK